MIEIGPEKKLLLTGAGGWLGTELLELLLFQYGGDILRESVICLGSQARSRVLSDGTKINIHPFFGNLEINDLYGMVHLAFQTRDKVSELGIENYCFTNLSITSRAVELIETLNPIWVATVSSGAVFSSPNGPLEHNLMQNPYGFTKRIEETMLIDVAESLGINLAIGRLWGAMGEFMPVNRAYAVSDFICQANQESRIVIRSGHKVWRRYCDASEFMNILTTTAEKNKFTQFDSGGTLIEVGDLAVKIASHFDQHIEIVRSRSSDVEDSYYPENSEFQNLSRFFEIELTPFDQTLVKTIDNHIRVL